ncbi:MAG: acyl-CoA dehydrogenase family protein [Acidobacteriota bacterium]
MTILEHKTTTSNPTDRAGSPRDWDARARRLARGFAADAAATDASGEFVHANFDVLREQGALAMAVPTEMGGDGASYSTVCSVLRTLAQGCPSTALALSMHQHVVAAQLWSHRQGGPGQAVLERVAREDIVLVSTGGTDWLSSNGTVEAVEGGFKVTARKVFASGSPAGDVLVTSAPYEDPDEGWQVLHFPVSLSAGGVSLEDDWDVVGMRGTGSQTVVLNEVFVPEGSVGLRRPRGEWHPVWNTVLTVALPIISSVYVGIAERAAELARASARGDAGRLCDAHGDLENELTAARIALESLIDNAQEGHFTNSLERANAALVRKTLAIEAAQRATAAAVEAAGGRSFYRDFGLEQLWRDVQAGSFHPLPKRRQVRFSGSVALGLDPSEA